VATDNCPVMVYNCVADLEKVMVHPALHIVTTDRSKCKARSGII
jgi:hypothetical protein